MFETKNEVFVATMRAVCGEMGLAPAAVGSRGNQNRKTLEARRIIVARLHDAGFSTLDIANLLQMNRATTQKYLREHVGVA